MVKDFKFDFTSEIVRTQYKNSILKEVFRKSIHLCSAFIPIFLAFAKYQVIVLLSIVLLFYVISELLRLKGISIPLISKVTEVASRKRDENKFVLGPVTLVAGIIAAALLWNEKAAAVGILALAFG